MLCEVVTKNKPDAYGKPGSELQRQLEDTLAVVANQVSSAALWDVYAKYYADIGNKEKVIEYREKECRASQKPGWENEQKLFEGKFYYTNLVFYINLKILKNMERQH